MGLHLGVGSDPEFGFSGDLRGIKKSDLVVGLAWI